VPLAPLTLAAPALAEEAAAQAGDAVAAAGYSPKELALVLAPLLIYGGFRVYRDKVNPKVRPALAWPGLYAPLAFTQGSTEAQSAHARARAYLAARPARPFLWKERPPLVGWVAGSTAWTCLARGPRPAPPSNSPPSPICAAQAKIGDLVYILAAAAILGNITSIVIFKTRYF
jgi:hypothetical protein